MQDAGVIQRPLAAAILMVALGGLPAEFVSSSEASTPALPAGPAEAAPASPGPAGPVASPPREPVALPESEVPRAAIAAETRVRAVRSLAARTLETEEIAASEKDILESVEALKEWMRSREPRQQTPRSLRSLGQEWLVDEETLGTWMETTSRRLDSLSTARAELQGFENLWAATEAKLEADAAPVEIRERVRGVLDSIREVGALVDAEIEKVLLLQSRVSAARLDAQEALDTIAAALREERTTLLTIGSPPIWRMIGPETGRKSISAELRAAVAEGGRALKQYAARAPRNLWFQLAFFLLLAVAFHRLRHASRTWEPDDNGLRACARLVQRPVLGAALIALLCGLWIHPRAPLAFYEISSILLTVPVVILLRGMVQPARRGALTAVAVIFAAERLWETSSAGSFLERTVLLALTVLSAAVIVWTLRTRAPLPAGKGQRWLGAMTVAGKIALAALAVSLVANVIGNVSLARLLTATVVRAGYTGVVLYAAALLLRGATTLLVRAAAANSFRTIERHAPLIRHRAALAIDTGVVLLFVYWVLKAAGLVPVVREAAAETFLRPWGIGDFSFSIASGLVFVAAVYASIVVSRVSRAVLEEDLYPRISLPRGVPSTVTMLTRYGVISLGFLLALSIAGIPLDRLAIILGAFSVGIGFGLQTVVNNFVSGMILMFERPIQIGDTVEVSGLVGRVRRIGVRASTIETFDGAEVIVPNGTLVSDQLINWTLTTQSRRAEIQVGVSYGTDPETVLVLLREATQGHPRVLAEPEPTVIFRGFGESSLDFSVLFWTDDFEGWMAVRSDVTVKINRALAGAGISPFPSQEVPIAD